MKLANEAKRARVVCEQLSDMIAENDAFMESNPIEQGIAEIMRQNRFTLVEALQLLNAAYLQGGFYYTGKLNAKS